MPIIGEIWILLLIGVSPLFYLNRSRILLLSSALTLGSVLYGHAQAAEEHSASHYYEDAVKRFSENEFNEAVIQLKNALQINPRLLPALALLGQAYIRTGNAAAAESALSDAISAGADPSLLAVPLAKAYLSQMKYDLLLAQAIPKNLPDSVLVELLSIRANSALAINNEKAFNEVLLKLEGINPDGLEYLNLTSAQQMKMGNYEQAQAIVDRMILLYPNKETAWLSSASYKHLRGDLDGAIADYERVLSINEKHFSARLAHAGLLVDLNRNEEATKDLQRLVKADSGDPRVHYLRSITFARAGDEHASRSELNLVINAIDGLDKELVTRNDQLLLVAGIAHYTLGSPELARNYFENYEEIGGADIGPLKLLATVYLDDKAYFPAVSLLENISNRVPLTMELLSLLTQAYHGAGLHEKAIALMEMATSYEDTPEPLFTQRAITRLEAGYIERGIAELQEIFNKRQSNKLAGIALATTYLKRNNYLAADQIAEQLLAANPSDPSYVNLISITKLAIGDTTSARKAVLSYLESDPEYVVSARISLAKIDIEEGQAEDARVILQDILDSIEQSSRKHHPMAMLQMAKSYQIEGNLKNALSWARKAAAKANDSLIMQKYLFDLLLQNEALDEASNLAYELESKSPNDLSVMELQIPLLKAKDETGKLSAHLQNMAGAAGSHTDWLSRIARHQVDINALSDAAYTLFKAIQVNPDSIAIQAQLAEVELKLNRIDSATDRIANLTIKHPDQAIGHSLTGDQKMQAGKPAQAIQSYATAQKIQPNTRHLIRLYLAQRSAGKSNSAEQTLLGWLKLHPEDIIARHAVAEHYLANQQWQRSIGYYQDLLETRPNDALLHNHVAYAYGKLNQIDQALAHANSAIALQSDNAAINDTLGWLLVQQGKFDQALQYLREALTRNSHNAEIRYHLAAALIGLNRNDEARTELLLSLESNQTFDGRDQAQAMLDQLQNR